MKEITVEDLLVLTYEPFYIILSDDTVGEYDWEEACKRLNDWWREHNDTGPRASSVL